MILTKKVMIKVNVNNIKNLEKNGYIANLNDEIEIDVEHLSVGSHVKIEVKCDVCGKERGNLMYKEYLTNLKSGGYYSCKGKCSSDKNKKTCLEKYGVDNPTKSIDILNKRELNLISEYGVDYQKLFSDRIKKSLSDRYGVDNPSKVEVEKRLIKKGLSLKTDFFMRYRTIVDNLTKKNKKELFEKWDGYDSYDGEYIKDNLNLKGQHGDYPTIDHIVSVKQCFIDGLLPIYVAELVNLCITKRRLNSKKGIKNNFELLNMCI